MKYVKWSKEEDDIILSGVHNKKTIKEIHSEIPWRTISSIQCRLGKISDCKRKYWSEEEDLLLKNLYSNTHIDELLELLPNRTRNAIILHAGKLGLYSYVDTKHYSNDEENFIINNYKNMTDKELALHLGRSIGSIKNRRALMGLFRTSKEGTKYESTSVYVRRHNVEWKKKSMLNSHYKCVVTGKRFEEIHHLVSLNFILNNVYKKLNIDKEIFDINSLSDEDKESFMRCVYIEQSQYPLGICLTKEIHSQFHTQYGYGNNTIEQFQEFLKNNYSEVKLNFN